MSKLKTFKVTWVETFEAEVKAVDGAHAEALALSSTNKAARDIVSMRTEEL